MIKGLALALVIATAVGAAAQSQSPPPVFRSATHAVSLDVSVFQGDTVVSDLLRQDFEVKDNNVRQTITAADFNILPIDLRLVFDTSGSISDQDFARYLKTMNQVAATLKKDDRCEILTFSRRIAEAADRQYPPVKVTLERTDPEGTSFFDAVSLAMVTVPMSDRRQITIVLSDAKDNVSFFDEPTMVDAARRTDAVVYAVLPGDPRAAKAISVVRLQALSLLTGGRLLRTPEQAVANAVISTIEEFRKSYVLRYTLTGVPIEGWHAIDVRVKKPDEPPMYVMNNIYRVRTRLGYYGR